MGPAGYGSGRLRSRERSVAPERLVDLEIDVARAEAEVTQAPGIELGELGTGPRTLPPGGEDLVERRERAGQRRLGTVVKSDIGHGTSPGLLCCWGFAPRGPSLQTTVCPVLINLAHVKDIAFGRDLA